jgi:1-acyl-sn-glycerol-3-phosphate acyltransferase
MDSLGTARKIAGQRDTPDQTLFDEQGVHPEGLHGPRDARAITPGELTPVGLRRPGRALTGEMLKALDRHNGRVGTLAQTLVHRFVFLFLVGPIVYPLLRLFFRVELRGAERRKFMSGRSMIYAVRHNHEWDPFVTWTVACWRPALRHWSMVNLSTAGPFWVKTRFRRFVSWCLGVMGLQKGRGHDQSAITRFAELDQRGRFSISIFPTGPLGRAASYRLGAGVAHLAMRCPDVPLMPVSLLGLSHVRLRDVLLFKRPPVTVVLGESFTAREILGSTEVRINSICQRIEDAWVDHEDACRERHPRGSRAARDPDDLPALTG